MAKYKLVNYSVSAESQIGDRVNGEVIMTDKYMATITIEIGSTDGVADNFIRTIQTISDNAQDGFEVDDQREAEVNAFVDNLNK